MISSFGTSSMLNVSPNWVVLDSSQSQDRMDERERLRSEEDRVASTYCPRVYSSLDILDKH